MKNSAEERIIGLIKKELEKGMKYWTKNNFINESGEICDDLVEAMNLCDKLLTEDYFEESEDIINDWLDRKEVVALKSMTDKWSSLYRKDVKRKKKDLTRLFKLVVDHIEDLD